MKNAWLAIHIAADPYLTYTDETFDQEFGADRLVDGAPFTRVTAREHRWARRRPGSIPMRKWEAYGPVHWVAIHPAHQGRGLAKPLLGLICARLRELGHERGYLNTASARIPAISLYLQFGFVPQMRRDRENTLRAWQQVSERLSHPAIAEFLKTMTVQ
ncbi:MAG: GNAT family N-acetyltransferase [Caldilineaceae bacterium]